MKKLITILSFVCAAGLKAQNTPDSPDTLATETATARTRTLKTEQTVRRRYEDLEKFFSYSGFLVDLARTNQPLRMLDLRTPVNMEKDQENLGLDTRRDRPQGFKLFSIDF